MVERLVVVTKTVTNFERCNRFGYSFGEDQPNPVETFSLSRYAAEPTSIYDVILTAKDSTKMTSLQIAYFLIAIAYLYAVVALYSSH